MYNWTLQKPPTRSFTKCYCSTKEYPTIDSPITSSLLQQDLDCLHKWCHDWTMSFNVSKCTVMHISRKKSRENIDRLYHLGGQPLECVPHTIDLGITITNNLSWARHIESISAKANKTLGLLRECARILQTPLPGSCFTVLWSGQLQYGSNLFSPYSVKHHLQVEKSNADQQILGR